MSSRRDRQQRPASEHRAQGKPIPFETAEEREARAYWESLAGHPLTDEEMREIGANLAAYFALLNELDIQLKGGFKNEDQEKT